MDKELEYRTILDKLQGSIQVLISLFEEDNIYNDKWITHHTQHLKDALRESEKSTDKLQSNETLQRLLPSL